MDLFNIEVILKEDTLNYSLSSYTPLNIKINPSQLYGNGTTNKIRKIVYNWPDGTSETKDFIPTLKNDSWTTFPEFGNPLNYVVNKNLYSTREENNITNKVINIECFYFGTDNKKTYKINLSAHKPYIEGYKNGDFFNDITLLDARMFGPNNTLIYVFETRGKEKDFILMSTVNWQLLPEEIINKKLPPIKPYRFFLPFDNTKQIDFKYEKVPFLKSNPSRNSNDSGGGYI